MAPSYATYAHTQAGWESQCNRMSSISCVSMRTSGTVTVDRSRQTSSRVLAALRFRLHWCSSPHRKSQREWKPYECIPARFPCQIMLTDSSPGTAQRGAQIQIKCKAFCRASMPTMQRRIRL